MNEFDKSWQELQNFFEERGHPSPIRAAGEIRLALNVCLNLVPPLPNDTNRIVLNPDEVFGVQQFVTKFGCHLNYQFTIYTGNVVSSFAYTITPNWK